jgi:hypothetical protein
MAWVHSRLCKLQKRCTRLAAASDKVYHCLSMVGGSVLVLRHEIAEILLKVALKHKNPNLCDKGYHRHGSCGLYSKSTSLLEYAHIVAVIIA